MGVVLFALVALAVLGVLAALFAVRLLIGFALLAGYAVAGIATSLAVVSRWLLAGPRRV